MFLNFYFHLNSLLIPPLGLLLNFILLWLILRRTPKEMWLHSRVLLQTCILDILLLIVFMFGMPYGALVGDRTLYIYEGYLLGSALKLFDLSDPICMLNLFCCWFFLYNFDVMGIAVQFLYRYLLLNRSIKINLRRYLCLLIIPFIVSGWSIFIVHKSFKQGIETSQTELSNFNVDFNDTQIIYGLSVFDEFFTRIGILHYSLFYAISYSIIFICGRKMVKYVAAHAMHENLKALNKQLSKSLIICATFPVLLEAAHILMILGIIVPSIMNASLILSSLFCWLPVLNPLASLWTFRPYRDLLIGSFKKARISPQ